MTGKQSGYSTGTGVVLVAETIIGSYFSAEAILRASKNNSKLIENFGREIGLKLIEKLQTGGIVDSDHQVFLLLLCAIGKDEFHKIQFGPLNQHAKGSLKLIEKHIGVKFDMETNFANQ